jgi:UDP-N-acetyl-D-mannosaminuronate dehydrogenase
VRITVVASGMIGLALAVQFAERGHRVGGAHINPTVVNLVKRRPEPFPGETQLADTLAAVVGVGNLTATTDTVAAVSQTAAVVVIVPHFVDSPGEPGFGWKDAATADIGRRLRPARGNLRGPRVVVLGVAYRGGVKEATFPESLTRWQPYEPKEQKLECLTTAPAGRVGMCGFQAYAMGEPADVVILQTDYERYSSEQGRTSRAKAILVV